jgi:hypothetical protein
MNILSSEFLHPKKKHNRTLIFGITLLKYGRHFDCWNQPLNMRMRVCYLDWHDAGLCCYLVIHISNLLHPLQLYYFHLWPINWLALLNKRRRYNICYIMALSSGSCNSFMCSSYNVLNSAPEDSSIGPKHVTRFQWLSILIKVCYFDGCLINTD